MKTTKLFTLITLSAVMILFSACKKNNLDSNWEDGPQSGNPDGNYDIPKEADLVDVSNPDHIIGNGTPESCTEEEFREAVALGGIIIFDTGGKSVTIELKETVKIFNDANPDVVIDGGGRFKAVNCRFFNNVCQETGPDVGGACIRVTSQYENMPVYITNCTFGGAEGYGNSGSNGSAISSIGVSWTIINCLFSYNKAIGNGGNPAESGTPGGGSGGAIYNDGNTMTLSILGSKIEYNEVNAYGSAIFFVTNDHSGNIIIKDSYIKNNIGGSWYPEYNGISAHADTDIEVTNSVIE